MEQTGVCIVMHTKSNDTVSAMPNRLRIIYSHMFTTKWEHSKVRNIPQISIFLYIYVLIIISVFRRDGVTYYFYLWYTNSCRILFQI